MNTQSQRGDMMAAAMIGLVVVALGALGYIVWQNYGGSDKNNTTPTAQQEQPTATSGSKVPEGWVRKTDKATGMSYAIPENWMTEGCGDSPCDDVLVKTHGVDVTIFPMKGPSAINAVRYDTKAAAWQAVDGVTGEKGDQTIITDVGKVQGEYEAIRYTGGDGMMAQTHILIHKGEAVYQLALPRTIGDIKIQNEKTNKAAEVVKTITIE